VELHRVQVDDNVTRVTETEQLQTFEPQLEHNETWQQRHSVRPETTGERLRFQFLLYRGDVPPDPSAGNAYRSVHVWVNVTSR